MAKIDKLSSLSDVRWLQANRDVYNFANVPEADAPTQWVEGSATSGGGSIDWGGFYGVEMSVDEEDGNARLRGIPAANDGNFAVNVTFRVAEAGTTGDAAIGIFRQDRISDGVGYDIVNEQFFRDGTTETESIEDPDDDRFASLWVLNDRTRGVSELILTAGSDEYSTTFTSTGAFDPRTTVFLGDTDAAIEVGSVSWGPTLPDY